MGRSEHLQKIIEKNGELPFPKENDYTSLEQKGEVPFTNILLQLGLEILPLDNYTPYCKNHMKHPHSTLAPKLNVDLNHVPLDQFFYQIGCLDTDFPI